MSSSASSQPRQSPVHLLDWLWPHLRWIILPSWFLSLLLHGILAIIVLTLSQMPGCRGDFGGESGEHFRSVGIRQKSESPNEQQGDEHPEPTEPVEDVQIAQAAPTVVPNQPPVPLVLPQVESAMPAVVGAGSLAQFDATQFSDLIKPSNAASPQALGGGVPDGGPRATSFLGVSDSGRSFVYVIDRSSSMEDDGRLRAAKMELLTSLQQLDDTQRFQIIFYNAKFTVLQPRQDQPENMFVGNDSQRLQVVEQLREITPSGGTLHYPAIMRALQFRPDVIFLLTDGDPNSALTRHELEEIRVRNGAGTHIHCIEFGKGSISVNGRDAKSGNYLDRLSQENGGQYTYRNVLELRGG